MIVEAFIFGLTLALTIGPIALLIVDTGIRFGTRAALASRLDAAVGDLVCAAVALAAGTVLAPVLDAHRWALHAAASLLLLGFGLRMLTTTTGSSMSSMALREPVHAGRPFLTTFGLTIVKPLTILAFIGFVGELGIELHPLSAVACTLALFMGSLSVQTILALGGAALGTRLQDDRWLRWFNAASAAGIVAFGIVGFTRGSGVTQS